MKSNALRGNKIMMVAATLLIILGVAIVAMSLQTQRKADQMVERVIETPADNGGKEPLRPARDSPIPPPPVQQ